MMMSMATTMTMTAMTMSRMGWRNDNDDDADGGNAIRCLPSAKDGNEFPVCRFTVSNVPG